MEFVCYGRSRQPLARPPAATATPAAATPPDPDRIAWVDTAKGLCIILVVTMHATLGVEAELGREGFMHWAVAFSKPFRMPDFFLLSGLFLARVIDRDWRSYADKRVVHFLYFYLLWLVIQSVFKVGTVSGGTLSGFLTHLATALIEPYSTLWFVYILAVLSVVTKLLRQVRPTIVLAAAAALQILPVATGSFLIDEFCGRWVYFLAGYLFASQIFKLADWARRQTGPALAALAAWALCNAGLALTAIDLGRVTTLAEVPVISLAAGLAGASAVVVAAVLLGRVRLAVPLRYCGANSIAIYLTFFIPMALTRTVLVRTGVIEDAGIVAAIVTGIAVLVPLGIERLVRDTRFALLYRRPAWARLAPARTALKLQPAV